jgi:hypothetical protein
MTTTQPNPYPVTSAAPTAGPANDRTRRLLGAVTVFLGAYLVLLSLMNGQFLLSLGGMSMGLSFEFALVQLLQFVFAVIVVIAGILFTRSTVGAKLAASAAFVVLIVLHLMLSVARSSTGFGGIPLGMTLANTAFMVVFSAGVAWLIVSRAKLGWLSLLLTGVLIPVPFWMTLAGVSAGWIQFVLLPLCAVIGIVILVSGRPSRLLFV